MYNFYATEIRTQIIILAPAYENRTTAVII